MIAFRSIFFVVGILCLMMSGVMILPMLLEMRDGSPDWIAFAFSSMLGSVLGVLITLSTRPTKAPTFHVQEVFLLTALSWISACALGALPFLMSPTLHISVVDAFFEATSGMTTTGSTVLLGLDHTSRGILLWRALLQAVGGIGIMVMALTVLPFLKIGGMQLFHSEFSDRSEKILPRVSQITSAIFSIYFLLTLVCALSLGLAGMPVFDAVCHALSTLSTGGFSTHDQSIGAYADNTAVQVILMFFMFIGGSTLVLFVRFGRGESRILWQDAQMRVYSAMILLSVLLIAVWQVFHNESTWSDAFLQCGFSVISVITTTGFTTSDYTAWGGFPIVIFFFLMFLGGCTGSTSGGIKIFRFQVLFLVARMNLKLLRRPHGIFLPTYNGRPVTDALILSVLTFVALYMFCFAMIAIALSLTELDLSTALSASVAAISNVGPGLTPQIGPTGTYAGFSDTAKWIISGAMILGRLELFTILILFTTSFWRD